MCFTCNCLCLMESVCVLLLQWGVAWGLQAFGWILKLSNGILTCSSCKRNVFFQSNSKWEWKGDFTLEVSCPFWHEYVAVTTCSSALTIITKTKMDLAEKKKKRKSHYIWKVMLNMPPQSRWFKLNTENHTFYLVFYLCIK